MNNQETKEYMRKWRENNRDKLRKQNKERYNKYIKDNEKVKEYQKSYKEKNREKFKRYKNKWDKENKDKVIGYRKKHKDNIRKATLKIIHKKRFGGLREEILENRKRIGRRGTRRTWSRPESETAPSCLGADFRELFASTQV
jgi:hypothetical protein